MHSASYDTQYLNCVVYSFQRPLLVLVDRNVDLATPLHHTWTYQALCHDVLGLGLNTVTVSEQDSTQSPSSTPRTKPKKYELDNRDGFWQSHKGKVTDLTVD